jgi:hypothetical protein
MAALTVPRTGLGASISGSGLITGSITRIGEMTISADPLDITDLSTTAYEKNVPGDIRKNPEFEVEFYFLGAALPITTAMMPTGTTSYSGISATITLPAAGSFQGTGFVKSVKTPQAVKGDIMKGGYTFMFDGATAISQTVA